MTSDSPELGAVLDNPPAARSNMPILLSLSVPGLGHAFYGAPLPGILALIESLVLVLFAVYAGFVMLFGFLGGTGGTRGALILGGILVYGLIFTGLVTLDAYKLQERDGKVTPAMHVALVSGVLVAALAAWLLH